MGDADLSLSYGPEERRGRVWIGFSHGRTETRGAGGHAFVFIDVGGNSEYPIADSTMPTKAVGLLVELGLQKLNGKETRFTQHQSRRWTTYRFGMYAFKERE